MNLALDKITNNICKILDILKSSFIKTGKRVFNAFRHPTAKMRCFYILTIVGIGCFIASWIQHCFRVPLNGDYSLQEMTFIYNTYDDWHHFFKTGEFILWDRSIFLGVDNVGGNSFYYLFDPYILIMLPFPREWLEVLQGLEFVPRMVICGMLFYSFLSEFKLSEKTRTIGALAFAFTGYAFNYLWFQFGDVLSFYPLMIWGIERIIKKHDPRIFLLGCFIVGATNYFFFAVYLIGCLFYAMFRYFQTCKKRNYKENMGLLGFGVICFLIGILLAAFTLLPGLKVAFSMPRTKNASYLSNILDAEGLKAKIEAIFTYLNLSEQNRVTPLLNFLFMNDNCYSSNLLNVYWYDNLQCSLYATTPMLLFFFVGIIDAIKERKWSYLIAVAGSAFLIFTPIGFNLFSGFTVPYARYFIIIVSWMIIFDCITIEKRRKIPRTYLDISLLITASLMAISCFLIVYTVNKFPAYFTEETYWDVSMWLVVYQLIWLFVCYLAIRPCFHKKAFSKVMIIFTGLDIIIMANATIIGEGTNYNYANEYYPEETKIVQLLKHDEGNQDFYRIYNSNVTRNNTNASMIEGYNGLSDFHSVYAFNTQDFLDRSRIPYSSKNWSMGVHNRRYNLETFLGTKYYITDRVNDEYKTNTNLLTNNGFNTLSIPKAYPERKDSSNHTVYATDYDIPFGYVDVRNLTDEQKEKFDINFSKDLIDFLNSDKCKRALYVNTNFIDTGFAFDKILNTAWLSNNASTKKRDEDYQYLDYEDLNEYPLLRFAMLDNDDFNYFAKRNYNNYNAYNIDFYDDRTSSFDINQKGTISNQRNTYLNELYNRNSMSSYKSFYNGDLSPSAPIQNIYGQNNLKITLYKSNWPATEKRASGEFAYCDATDALNTQCLDQYKKEHPWEDANGIYPGNTKLDFYNMIDEDGNSQTRECLYNSKIVIEPTANSCPSQYEQLDEKGNSVKVFCPSKLYPDGAYLSINNRQKIEWRLYDVNDQLISYGLHSFSNYKQAHGYYTDRPIKRIVGTLKDGSYGKYVTISEPSLYIQDNRDYQHAIDKLKENQIIIDKSRRGENTLYFDTNYDKDMFEVLNYPKEDGFKLYHLVVDEESSKTKKEEVTLYKAQGGFIGFEAKAGKQSYLLEYKSTSYNIGGLLTTIGILLTGAFFIFYSYKESKEKIEKELTIKYNIGQFVQNDEYRRNNYESEKRR